MSVTREVHISGLVIRSLDLNRIALKARLLLWDEYLTRRRTLETLKVCAKAFLNMTTLHLQNKHFLNM